MSLEFMAMTGLAGIALLIMIGVAYSMFSDNIEQVIEERFNDLGASIQGEIILASEVHEGYSRNITVPSQLQGMDYQIYIQDDFLVLNHSRGAQIFPLPPVAGSISKGKIQIQNVNGDVQIS